MTSPVPQAPQDFLRFINSSQERALAQARVAERLSNLKITGDLRRFLVARMGSTGSTWLAKLLNSHPDAYCTHEGIIAQVYPKTQYTNEDIFRFIEYFAWDEKHRAYAALGDIGSAWAGHLAFLPAFTTGLLIRHPARILHTRLSTYSEDQSFTVISPESAITLRELWGIDLNRYDPIDQIFLYDTTTFAAQLWSVNKIDLIIRIEDLNNIGYCRETLRALTGLDYEEKLIASAVGQRINQRSGPPMSVREMIAQFNPRQRDWYSSLLAGIAPSFGYTLFE